MKKKLFISALVVIALGIVSIWFFVFYKPTHFKRNIANEKGIQVTSEAIVKAYTANEDSARILYGGKVLEVTGPVLEVKKNEEGNATVTLKSGDSFSNVYCTLKDKAPLLSTGAVITIKGICTGFLSDVVIIDAIIVK
jgi:hypothetical protein